MKRKYTKSHRWYSNQANRTVGAAHRRADKAMGQAFKGMGCALPLAVLLVSTVAIFVGWTFV